METILLIWKPLPAGLMIDLLQLERDYDFVMLFPSFHLVASRKKYEMLGA